MQSENATEPTELTKECTAPPDSSYMTINWLRISKTTNRLRINCTNWFIWQSCYEYKAARRLYWTTHCNHKSCEGAHSQALKHHNDWTTWTDHWAETTCNAWMLNQLACSSDEELKKATAETLITENTEPTESTVSTDLTVLHTEYTTENSLRITECHCKLTVNALRIHWEQTHWNNKYSASQLNQLNVHAPQSFTLASLCKFVSRLLVFWKNLLPLWLLARMPRSLRPRGACHGKRMKLKRIKDLLPEYCIEIPTTALVMLVKGPIHKYSLNAHCDVNEI